MFTVLLFVMSVLHLRFYRLTMSYKHVLTKKINSDFLHGRKALKRDKHCPLFQSSPKINHESRHDSHPQFPRSSLGTRGLQTRSHRPKKKRLHFKSLTLLKARSTKNARMIQNREHYACVTRFSLPADRFHTETGGRFVFT